MRLIDPRNISAKRYKDACDDFECGWNACINEIMECVQQIEAEPVRHEGTTTFIDVDHIDEFQTRIILTEKKKSKFCRVFYEDDREHGRWVDGMPYINSHWRVCSVCHQSADHPAGGHEYCGHCGAKMDGGADG